MHRKVLRPREVQKAGQCSKQSSSIRGRDDQELHTHIVVIWHAKLYWSWPVFWPRNLNSSKNPLVVNSYAWLDKIAKLDPWSLIAAVHSIESLILSGFFLHMEFCLHSRSFCVQCGSLVTWQFLRRSFEDLKCSWYCSNEMVVLRE